MSINYPVSGLRTLAAASAVGSSFAAFPAVSNLAGDVPAALALACSTAITYAGWHISSSDENTDKRIISGAVALAFAAMTTVGIHASGELKTSQNASGAAESADKLYQEQEAGRLAALSAVTAELRATSKNKYPNEYANLQAQVDKLSTPTVRKSTATQITQGLSDTGGIYRWMLAGAYEVFAPALLLLAGMFTQRKQGVNTASTPVNTALTQEKQPLVESELTPQLTALTPVNGESDEVLTALTDPLTALTRRSIAPTDEGFITAKQLVSATNCTDRQAREAIKQAAEDGILESIGSGNATRYRYAKPQLRSVK